MTSSTNAIMKRAAKLASPEEEWGLWDMMVAQERFMRPVVLVFSCEESKSWTRIGLTNMIANFVGPGLILPSAPVGEPIYVLATKTNTESTHTPLQHMTHWTPLLATGAAEEEMDDVMYQRHMHEEKMEWEQ